MPKTSSKKIKVTLVRSTFGKKPTHAACVKGLGLRHIRHHVILDATPQVMGMINKVSFMVSVEEVK